MKINKKVIKIFIYLLITFGVIIFINKFKEEFSNISIVKPIFLIPLSILVLIFFAVNGLVNKILLKEFKIYLTFKEWFGLSIINTIGNYIAPFRGGSISNALYLKKKYKFSYSSFLSLLSATYIIVFWVNSLLGIVSLIFVKVFYNNFSIIIFLFFLLIFLTLTTLILLSPKIKTSKYIYLNKFIDVINNWHTTRKNLKIIMIISFLAFLNNILIVSMSYLEFLILGEYIVISKLFVLSVFSSFSIFLSITPGNLGIREAFSVYSGQLLGIPIVKVVAISIIDRFINFILSFILSLYFTNTLLGKTVKHKELINNK